MTSSGNPVTLRLITEHDLPMLHDWLNRPHIVEWWGGDEARPTLRAVTERYLLRVLVKVGVTPYIAMLNQEPIGYTQSYVALVVTPDGPALYMSQTRLSYQLARGVVPIA